MERPCQRPPTRAPNPATTLLPNRELSQIDLMGRVLDLAADSNEPLLERVKFCGIVSSILDEFFMVPSQGCRIRCFPGFRCGRPTAGPTTGAHGHPGQRPRSDGPAVGLWRDQLCPALAAEGIIVGAVEDARKPS